MLEKLKSISDRYDKLTELLSDQATLADMNEFKKLSKERADMDETVQKYQEYKKVEKERSDAEELIKSETDQEMKELLSDEILSCKKRLEAITEELKILLIPKDPNDDKNVILEIRGGAGGEEAALFAYELYRMYVKYAEKNRWKTEEIDSNTTELGGVKEVTFSVSGKGVYSKLKFESGVHRVQRVP
ncbi:MAG: PCRF domain-containing protein, partial [Clostridia bacterium]|nr:PCRF domain-containing protein [Clostridia bacterium]